MSNSMLVRASRDGDQFHYLWAARRALQLLQPESGLVAITIEGASTTELHTIETIDAGEELIDIAEYHGSTAIEQATLVRYMQLKHSTLHVDEVWQPSGLEKTIKGFAERFAALKQQLPNEPLHEKLEFWFVTNRPISINFIEAVEDAATQHVSRHPIDLNKLKKFTAFDGAELALFCKMLRFEGREDGYWTQRNILSQDVAGYLPILDVDAPTRLKELVTRKALSESATDPAITKMDVLRALQTNENELFPAPCLIKPIKHAVSREQEMMLVESIVGAAGLPIIVHADAGVGKSIFSTRIGLCLPEGSVCLLYDCFGNGQYRSATGSRHRHRTALVQIANELAALSLCHPLIPTSHVDGSAYVHAFMYRIRQSISVLRAKNANAILCVVVDAADNAQMAANEINEPHSFVRDLLRETLPEGVRIVALCRPHRVALLNPPPEALLLELKPFSRNETATHLRQSFTEATEHDVDEFHRLSSHNPRVQALALSRNAPLPEILRLLGPNPTTVENTIGAILEQAIAKLRDAAGLVDGPQVDLICVGLAVLRPLIPISVLALMSEVNQAAIKSFALELGRPLIVNSDTIQFFDEPAETWFRERFRPDTASITEFVSRLKGLASSCAYVASVLPQLMLEAGQFNELVELALTSNGLPESNLIERRDIELQRLQFALKAALRARRYADAAKLALKAGGESAGDDRQRRLFQDNVDLASLFIDSNSVQVLVSRGTFGSGWVGAHHVYEAALLSGHTELIGDARSRLRMAEEWLRNWSKQSTDEREKERVSDEDRAVMAMAHLNVHGSKAAAHSLRVWRPRALSYSAGRIIARRLLDHGRYDDLDELAIAANNDLGLILAIAVEARNLHHLIPHEVAKRGFKLLSNHRVMLDEPRSSEDLALSAVRAMVEVAYRHGLCDATAGKSLLDRYLPKIPPYGLTSRHSDLRDHYMRAYSLRSALAGVQLQLVDLATDELRKEIEDEKRHSSSSELREFKEDIGALLPWYDLWVRTFLKQISSAQLYQEIAEAKRISAKAKNSYREESYTSNEIARLWIDSLIEAGGADKAAIQEIIEWSKSLKRQLFTPTLNRLARLSAKISGSEVLAFEFAQIAFSLLNDERSDAQSKAEGYVEIARSILGLSRTESEAYFNQAVEVTSKIGDENLARWDALIYLAERAAKADRPVAETAYKFARCAEVTKSYVERDKHFAWSATTNALVKLCPSSSLAIMSRWCDREFGNNNRILIPAIKALISSESLSPLDMLPFVSFRAEWDENKLLEAALTNCSDKETKTKAIDIVYRYMTLVEQSVEKWRSFEAITVSVGIELPGLKALIANRVAEETAVKKTGATSYTALMEPKENRDWDLVFFLCDMTQPIGISTAHQRFRAGDPPFYTEAFFREAFKRIPVGQEAEFVRAFDAIAEFDLYSLRTLIELFPSEWQGRLGIRVALATILKSFFRRFCMDITRNRHYEVLPIKRACELSGLDEAELMSVVLAEIGEITELAGSDRLFSIVNLLASKLTHDEALHSLSYGLDLLNGVLEDCDGDGPWSSELTPPTDVEDALAGYIWARLASPIAATRWEAAHVVVNLCALGRSRILAGLFHHAANHTTKPFGDLRFTFYSLHAQQWLLIATARAALEYGLVLTPYADYFVTNASTNQPHVLIRLFAARTALALEAQGLISLQPNVRQMLVDVNASPFEIITRPSSEEFINRKMNLDDNQGATDNDRYSFGIDFGPYWLEPLGRCFAISKPVMERETLKAIRAELGYMGSSNWDSDVRARLHLYQYEDANHSHGSYPRVDNHNFYLSYHAMMITAGRFLASTPLFKAENDWQDDRFAEWIERHDISRVDGRWLADRRDPRPIKQPKLLGELSKSEWLGTISADCFEQALYIEDGFLSVWGNWSNIDNNRVESISINSALVSTERSASLLRALQTTENPHDFCIPDTNHNLEIDHCPYLLKGWLVDDQSDRGIDDADPWAGNVRFPAPEPAEFVIQMMQLHTDSDHRIWHSSVNQILLLRSDTWGYFHERNDSEQSSGSRLQASLPLVVEFLKSIEMDLIVQVEIRRRSSYQQYTNRDNDELQNIPSSFRIFIVKSDCTISTL